MIWHPRPFERVRVHYNKRVAPSMPWHGRVGVVARLWNGRGPLNIGVRIDGVSVVINRGHLVAAEDRV